MSDFIVDKLTKSVGDKTVFRDISFIIHDLDPDWSDWCQWNRKDNAVGCVVRQVGFDGDVSPFC